MIVRKAQKSYATTSQIEGELYPGERVAVLEDVVTTGSAAIQSARALRRAGAVVQDAIVVIDREEGAPKRWPPKGCSSGRSSGARSSTSDGARGSDAPAA